MAKAKYRLRKGPDIPDYVVENIFSSPKGLAINFRYFYKRSEARAWAKACTGNRIRVFHLKFTLVSDKKR